MRFKMNVKRRTYSPLDSLRGKTAHLLRRGRFRLQKVSEFDVYEDTERY